MKSSEEYSRKIDEYIDRKVSSVHSYFDTTNQILGLIGFSLGLSCLGTNNPKLFASLCLILVAVSWGASIGRLRKDIDELKGLGHPSIMPLNVLKNTWQSIAAFAFLAAIAIGRITKDGIIIL